MYMSGLPNRTFCAVLDDMRSCYKTYNFGGISGLIEELQYIGNKMEAGLEDKDDVRKYNKERSRLKKSIRELQEERDTLENEVHSLKKKKGDNKEE